MVRLSCAGVAGGPGSAIIGQMNEPHEVPWPDPTKNATVQLPMVAMVALQGFLQTQSLQLELTTIGADGMPVYEASPQSAAAEPVLTMSGHKQVQLLLQMAAWGFAALGGLAFDVDAFLWIAMTAFAFTFARYLQELRSIRKTRFLRDRLREQGF